MRPVFVTLRVLLFTAGVILLAGAALAQQLQAPAARAASPMTARMSRTAASRSSSSVPVAAANAGTAPATKSPGASASSPGVQENEADMLIEGEQRFATNCSRCHQSPHHFPPRMMATIVRHMRVRATITDEDMRLILRYMTQ